MEVHDLCAQRITGQVTTCIIHFTDNLAVLFDVEMLACSDTVGQNIHNADLQLPCTGYSSRTTQHQVLLVALDSYIGRTAVVVDIHRIALRIVNAVTVQGIQSKADLLLAHGQFRLEHNIFLVFCADIADNHAVPGCIRTVNGIGLRTGQVSDVIDIGFTVGVSGNLGGIHLDGCTIVEVHDLSAKSIACEVTIRIVHFTDDLTVLFDVEMLACSDTVGQNIHNADLQFPSAGYRGRTAQHQVLLVALDSYIRHATVVVNIHRIALGIVNAVAI